MAIEYIHKSEHKIVFEREKNKQNKTLVSNGKNFPHLYWFPKYTYRSIKVSYKSQVYVFQGKHMRKSTCTVNACTSLPAIAPGLSPGYKGKTSTEQQTNKQNLI